MEIGTKDAAKMLGVTDRRVRQLITAGKLSSRTVGRTKLVQRRQVEALAKRRSVK